MDENKYLYIIETLNRQIIEYNNSKEYNLGRKIIRFISEIKKGKILLQFKRYYKKKQLNKLKTTSCAENCSKYEWENMLHGGGIGKKIVVYSCITGGYDDVKTPLYIPDNVDYVMFCENTENKQDAVWTFKKIPQDIKEKYNNAMINRWIKFHPHQLFADEYDIAIYIDGNITPISDLSIFADMIDDSAGLSMHKHCSRNCIYKESIACKILGKGNSEKISKQLERYNKEGFPAEYGMLECNVIVTDLNNQRSKNIFQLWWDELIYSDGGRDQIVLPYILWKEKISVKDVAKLGNNVYKNTKIFVSNHN